MQGSWSSDYKEALPLWFPPIVVQKYLPPLLHEAAYPRLRHSSLIFQYSPSLNFAMHKLNLTQKISDYEIFMF